MIYYIIHNISQAHLKNFVMALPDKIGHECGEDGSNLRLVMIDTF